MSRPRRRRSGGRQRIALRQLVLGGLLGLPFGVLAGAASPAAAEPNNYYAYTDGNGVLHITNVPDRSRGAWTLYKTLEGSGGDDVARGKASAHQGRAPVHLGAERLHRYDSHVRAAALRYQLPESLLRAVIHTESNFYAHAVSRAGAVGLMQLMPKTAKALGVRDPYEPSQNVHGGARYLRLLANRYDGDMVLVLAAYNAGAANVEKYGGVPPFSETRAYVRSVLRRYYAYERQQQLGVGDERPGPARHIAP